MAGALGGGRETKRQSARPLSGSVEVIKVRAREDVGPGCVYSLNEKRCVCTTLRKDRFITYSL